MFHIGPGATSSRALTRTNSVPLDRPEAAEPAGRAVHDGYVCDLCDSVADVDPGEWAQLVSTDDLAMDTRLIRHLERTLSEEGRF